MVLKAQRGASHPLAKQKGKKRRKEVTTSEDLSEWGRFGGLVGGLTSLFLVHLVYKIDFGDGATRILKSGLVVGISAGVGAGLFMGLGYVYNRVPIAGKIIVILLAGILILFAWQIVGVSDAPEPETGLG